MEILGNILLFLKTRCDRPQTFGVFHIVMLILTSAAAVFVIKGLPLTEKNLRRLLLVLSVATIVLEVYKQLVYSFDFVDGKFVFEYTWRVFPWQFCSTPMIAGLFAAIVKNERIHYGLCCYLATYGLFAGLLTVITGGNIFSAFVGVNFQTAVCHGSMTIIGLYLLATKYVRPEYSSVLYALPWFIGGVVIAVILNYTVYFCGVSGGQEFDMYYINPYFLDTVAAMKPFKLLSGHFIPLVYITVYTGFSFGIIFIRRLFMKKEEKATA